ncbi:MAG: 23S rRNA (uracil(1939)-C(5))-methyltransferase RlmD [Candidatus Poribacteria bacterium]
MRKRRKRTFAGTRLEEELASGLHLAEPQCRYHDSCGGCSWQQISYERQLEIKREWIEQTFREAGHGDVVIPMPIASPTPYGYRNKMEFSFAARRWLTQAEISSGEEFQREFALGLHAPGAYDRVIDIEACPLQSDAADAYLTATREFAMASGEPPYHLRQNTGFFRYLIVRHGFNTDETIVLIITSERKPDVMAAYVDHLRASGLSPACVANGVTDSVGSTSEGADIHIDAGEPVMHEKLNGAVFAFAPDSFFQPNTLAAGLLADVVSSMAGLTGSETVLDLYCGVGVLSILLAPHADKVIGMEKMASAVERARTNAALNDTPNTYFLTADLDEGVTLLPEGVRPDVVVTDPPRAGMHASAVQSLRAMAPARIVYVSCHPKRQAENLAALCAGDLYYIAETQPVDLFPQTPHVENVALLIRA